MNWMQGVAIILDLALRINTNGRMKSTGKASAIQVAQRLGFPGRTAREILPNVVLSMMVARAQAGDEWEPPETVQSALDKIGIPMAQIRAAVQEALDEDAEDAEPAAV